ncbi:MAG TPA: LysM domain-containing protein [Desulfobacterales bacterium]|nr:LysM domain-containing protein [Desulfobacterales bacterium]
MGNIISFRRKSVKTILQRLNYSFVLGLALFFICASCVPSPKTTNEKAENTTSPAYYLHTVKLPGESLSIIAKWYTGDLSNWKILAEFNPQINPNRIFKGDQIRIPTRLMIRNDAITQEFVDISQPKAVSRPQSFTSRKKSKTGQQPPSAAKQSKPQNEEEPMLFGPKGGPSGE